MVDSVKILVGTMTGTAELVADEISDVLVDKGLDVEIELMDDLDCSIFEDGSAYIICTSTYGQGDVPDNGQALFEALTKEAPDLSAISYGIFALGDMTYAATFCFAGTAFDEVMSKSGAKRIGDVLMHNAASGSLPEDEAGSWAEGWYDQLIASA